MNMNTQYYVVLAILSIILFAVLCWLFNMIYQQTKIPPFEKFRFEEKSKSQPMYQPMYGHDQRPNTTQGCDNVEDLVEQQLIGIQPNPLDFVGKF